MVLLSHSWLELQRSLGRVAPELQRTQPRNVLPSGGKVGAPLALAVTVALAVAPTLVCPLRQFHKQFWNLLKSFWSSWMILCVTWPMKKNKIRYPKVLFLACCYVFTYVNLQPIHNLFWGEVLKNDYRMFIFTEPCTSRNKLLDLQAWLVWWDLQDIHKRKELLFSSKYVRKLNHNLLSYKPIRIKFV